MHRTFCLGILLLVITIAAYGNSLTGAFVFDDQRLIVENDAIRSLWPTGLLLADTSRPVVMLSLAANYATGGLDITGYHVVNLAIHLLAGLMLFGLVRRTLKQLPRYTEELGAADFLAFAVALVWLVHPLGTQSVTYVIQRSESLMGLFYLACLYCVLRGSQALRSWPWYLASIAACWLGMGTKQVMVTAPVVVLLYDRIFLADSWSQVVRRRWAMYAAFVPALIWLGVETIHAASRTERASAGFGMPGVTSLEYLGSQGGVILHYLRLAFWPDRLCLDYWWQVARSPSAIVLPCAAVTALLLASFVLLRNCPRLGFLGLSFFLILAPTSSIMPISDLAAEHRMYLPLATLAVLVVLAWDRLERRFVHSSRARRVLGAALLGIVVVSLMLRTIDRNRDYQDLVGMWTDVLATAPHNAPRHYNLGHAKVQQGNLAEAIGHYEDALRLRRNYAEANNNLGNVLMKLDKYESAKTYLERPLQIDAEYAEAYHNLGLVLAHEGDEAAAQSCFEDAVRLDPNFADAHFNLGILFGRTLDYDQAESHLNEVLRIDPGYAQAHYYLGNVHGARGNERQAVEHFRQAVRIQPSLLEATKQLVWILAAHADSTLRNGREAVSWAEKSAAATGRNDPIVLDMLAASYAEASRWNDAVATAGEAVKLAAAAGQSDLARRIAARRELFQRRQPYRKSP